MKRNPFGIETKVGASAGAAFLVSTVFAALHYWWHVAVPPIYITGPITTLVAFAAGYLAKHTPRPGAPLPPIVQFTGKVSESDVAAVRSAFGEAMRAQPATATAAAVPPGWPDTTAYTQPAAPPPATEGDKP